MQKLSWKLLKSKKHKSGSYWLPDYKTFQMRKIRNIVSFFGIIFLLISCEKDNNIDTEKPIINTNFMDAFPQNCDTIYFGETFDVRALFTDNVELGSYSISIHNNFDHHSHSTEVAQCNMDAVKEPVNPYVFIEDFKIPEGLKEYISEVVISVPEGNGSEKFDEGDYHFFISLTDKEGWSTQMGLGMKILHR